MNFQSVLNFIDKLIYCLYRYINEEDRTTNIKEIYVTNTGVKLKSAFCIYSLH